MLILNNLSNSEFIAIMDSLQNSDPCNYFNKECDNCGTCLSTPMCKGNSCTFFNMDSSLCKGCDEL